MRMYLKTVNHLDDRELCKMIDHATKRYQLVETDYHTVKRMVDNIINAPYMHEANIIKNISKIIDIYYEYRSRYDYHLSDDRLINMIIKAYYDNYGVIDKSLKYMLDEVLS